MLLSHNAFKERLWKSLTNKFCHYLEKFTWNLHFCWIFADEKLFTWRSKKEAACCSFLRVLQHSYFGKVSLITFIDTLNKILKHRIFTDSFLIVNYIQGILRKELLSAPFVEPLKMLLWENLTNNIAITWNN